MKSTAIISFVLLAGLISCKTQRQNSTALNHRPAFVRISTKYPVYFETTDNRTWVPVMINYIVPAGQDELTAFATIESYFRNFSSNGGNAMRIWISSPFLEIEDEKAGQYSANKFARIDRVLQLAEKYHIRIIYTPAFDKLFYKFFPLFLIWVFLKTKKRQKKNYKDECITNHNSPVYSAKLTSIKIKIFMDAFSRIGC